MDQDISYTCAALTRLFDNKETIPPEALQEMMQIELRNLCAETLRRSAIQAQTMADNIVCRRK